MYSIPARFLNQIAETQPLRLTWTRSMFAMGQAELWDELDAQANCMDQEGEPGPVVSGYQLTAALLAENVAITAYINESDQHDLRMCMPEIVTVEEAVFIADQEYRLSDEHQDRLRAILSAMIEARDAGPEDPIHRLGQRLDANPLVRKLLLAAIESVKRGDRKD